MAWRKKNYSILYTCRQVDYLQKHAGKKDQDSNHAMLQVIGITYKKSTVFTVFKLWQTSAMI
jgi:hypothetical protein